jgi:PPOX class probable F420-dependent enzyme
MTARELDDAERAFVLQRKLARVATMCPDGTPHVVPVAYAFADGAFWMSSDPGDLKHRNLTTRPRAGLVVDDPPPDKRGVTVRGRADVYTEGELFDAAQEHLRAAGAGSRRHREPGEQVYIRLTPDSVASWRVSPPE